MQAKEKSALCQENHSQVQLIIFLFRNCCSNVKALLCLPWVITSLWMLFYLCTLTFQFLSASRKCSRVPRFCYTPVIIWICGWNFTSSLEFLQCPWVPICMDLWNPTHDLGRVLELAVTRVLPWHAKQCLRTWVHVDVTSWRAIRFRLWPVILHWKWSGYVGLLRAYGSGGYSGSPVAASLERALVAQRRGGIQRTRWPLYI